MPRKIGIAVRGQGGRVDQAPALELRERFGRVQPALLVEMFREIAAQQNLPRERRTSGIDPGVEPDRRGAVGRERVVEPGMLLQELSSRR